MLIDDLGIVSKLRRIAEPLASSPTEQDDLLQEALVHLWALERRCPGQSLSWYLQSCRFHLQHYLQRGRSIDSRKRGTGSAELPDEEETETPELIGQHDYAAQATVNDLVGVLSASLNSIEKQMLDCLLDGLTLREIASTLRISAPTALKYRRRIGDLFKRLEKAPRICLQVLGNAQPTARGFTSRQDRERVAG